MFQPAITALIQDTGNMSLIAWMMIYNFSKLPQAQASRLEANCWRFDIKLSLAKQIYIKFIYLNVGRGFEFVILPQFADR